MEKKWALVTGASSGIGLAYAEELASRGYQLVIVSNEEQAIREKGEFLSEKYGIEVLPLYRDLAIPGAAKELYDACQEKNIPVEVLVNNAGMFFFYETLQAKANIVEKMLYLHVTT
ncbi:SDR family NAD(P)-dependent oxidoreductase, partial [Parabacteroides distasonis]